MKESFNSKYTDHHSYLDKETRQKAGDADTLEDFITSNPRTRATYAVDLQHLREPDDASRGLEWESTLNRIRGYHVSDLGALSSCVGHDAFSGIFKQDMVRILEYWLKNNLVTLDDVNGSLNAFKSQLKGVDRQNYVSRVKITQKTNFILPGNMSQVISFC